MACINQHEAKSLKRHADYAAFSVLSTHAGKHALFLKCQLAKDAEAQTASTCLVLRS
jgi:hypothetical protein